MADLAAEYRQLPDAESQRLAGIAQLGAAAAGLSGRSALAARRVRRSSASSEGQLSALVAASYSAASAAIKEHQLQERMTVDTASSQLTQLALSSSSTPTSLPMAWGRAYFKPVNAGAVQQLQWNFDAAQPAAKMISSGRRERLQELDDEWVRKHRPLRA